MAESPTIMSVEELSVTKSETEKSVAMNENVNVEMTESIVGGGEVPTTAESAINTGLSLANQSEHEYTSFENVSVELTESVVGGGEVPTTAESATGMGLSVEKLDELGDLADQEQERIDIVEFRMKVDEMVLSLEIIPSKVLQRKMMKFDLNLSKQ